MPELNPATKGILKIGITAFVIVLLIRFVGWRDLVDTLAGSKWQWLVAMYGLRLVTFSVTARALFLLLRKIGIPITFGRVLYANAIASFYALIVPGDLFAGVSKWAILSAKTGERAKVLSAIVFNKLALAVSLVTFGSIAFARENPFPEAPFAPTAYLIGALVIAGTILALHVRTGAFVDRTTRAAARPFPAFVKRSVESLLNALQAFRAVGWRGHMQILLICAGGTLLGFTGFACATRALGLSVPLLALPWIASILFVSKFLPITMSNLGVREGILVLIFRFYEVPAAAAAGVGLLLFSNAVFSGLIGAACMIAAPLDKTPGMRAHRT